MPALEGAVSRVEWPGRVAVIGVGNMGLPIAERLVGAGAEVVVHDCRPEREALAAAFGAQPAATPAAAADGAALVIVVVVDALQTESVLFGDSGVVAALRPPAAVLLCPTIAPQDTERFAQRLASHGIAVVDAPMSGGPARAREGRMSLMVAGDDRAVERVRPWLDAIASPVFRVGVRPGDGARTKLVNNLLAAVHLAAAAEALALAQRVGLDPARTLDVIEQSSGASWIGSERGRRWLAVRAAGGDARQLEPKAHAALLAKDSGLAVAMARALDHAVPLGEQAAALFAAVCAAGQADLDDAVLFDRAWGREPTAGDDGPPHAA
jgi:3-hydroxyisobutyrate dehydrogenase